MTYKFKPLNKIKVFLLLICQPNLFGTSIVYNFRIAQITQQPFSDNSVQRHNTLIALLFDIYQKKYTGSNQNFTGELTGYIHNFNPYFFRIDFAFAHIKNKVNQQTTYTGTQTDDLLFTVGRIFHPSPKNSIILSGLFGIPTHANTILIHQSFGYAQVGLGPQIDGLYELNQNSSLIYGLRYLYFAPIKAYNSNQERFKITAGNIFDCLIASKTNWNKHGLEFGYTAKFDFGAHAKPMITDFAAQNNFMRSNLYLVYKYKFLINDIPNRVLFNIAFGRDHRSKIYGNKAIITSWFAWNINF